MAAPNPDEARVLMGKSINLKYDNNLFINGDTLLQDVQLPFSVNGPFAAPVLYTAGFSKVGNIVTIRIAGVLDSPGSTANVISSVAANFIPVAYRPAVPLFDYKIKTTCIVQDNGLEVAGWAVLWFFINGNIRLDIGVDPYRTAFTASANPTGLGTTSRVYFQYEL